MASGQLRFSSQEEPEPNDAVTDALAAFGLYSEAGVVVTEDEFWLWPESEEAFELWCSLQTQWNVDSGVRVGLNYQSVESCMRMTNVPRREHRKLFVFIQAMERAALEEWSAKR